MFPVVQKV